MKKKIKFISILVIAFFLFNLVGLRYTEAKDPYQFLYEYTVDKNNILGHMAELNNSRDAYTNSVKSYMDSIKSSKIAQSFLLDARKETDKIKKKNYYEKALESVGKAIFKVENAAKHYTMVINIWQSENIFKKYDEKSVEIYQEVQNWYNELTDSDEIPAELMGYLKDDVQAKINELEKPGGFEAFQKHNLLDIMNTKKSLDEINNEIKVEMKSGILDPWTKWEKIVIGTTIGLTATSCILSLLFFPPAVAVSCVYLPGFVLYVYTVLKDFRDSPEGIPGIVIAKGALNVRELPRRISKRIKQLQQNDKVTVKYITKDQSWYGIKLNGEIGWVFAEYVSLETSKGKIKN